ncbi:MAG: hemerythrin family protein [Dehalococcoidales bacterium]|nr:hemerythrin family protein [Dehalococcoidales bacterium]
MALITWDESLSVKMDDIDQQHQKLFGLINDVHQGMSSGKGNEILGKIMADLLQYTKDHFSYEEKMLKRIGYPKLAEHQKVHVYLTDQVKQLHDKIATGKPLSPVSVSNFLKDWLKSHILKVDMHYSKYYLSKQKAGVR